MLKLIDKIPSKYKYLLAIFHDLAIAFITFPLAIAIRLESFQFTPEIEQLEILLMTALGCKIIGIFLFKPYRGIWRFASINDLLQITKMVTVSSLMALAIIFAYNRLHTVPRSTFIIDWFITIFAMGGGRFIYRLWKESIKHLDGKRTVVIGAGRAGDQILRDIKRTVKSNINIIGVIDDSKQRNKQTLQGISIIGSIDELPKLVKEYDIEQAIFAIPSADSKLIRKVTNITNKLNLKLLTLPGINDLIDGKVHISQLRPVKIEDLLGRETVNLDLSSLTDLINNKTIMVTGAGGSIGSELCKQILKFGPEKLILFDSCEYFLYKIHLELSEKFLGNKIIPSIGNVRDEAKLDRVMNKYNPNIIFHAAAYKHVPMMERHPDEAIKTNVFGTENVVRQAINHNVERFVMVSTDKAVNPTNVMGATKRIAEQICQSYAPKSKTLFTIVRFGNVLGSAGSVVPRFLKQIENGGPVTVTHPEINRFFMSIPEACQLVLQTVALSKGGEIFVLDMGEPVKIVNLAKDLIKLSGSNLNDIEITFTGLRPGEKLYEELLCSNESTIETTHKKIRIAKAEIPDKNFLSQLSPLLNKDKTILKQIIKEILPDYLPKE